MVSQLPDTLIDRITDLFLPRILTEEDRKTLCLEAYLTTHRWLLRHLYFSGTPREFTIHTLDAFIQYGDHLAEPLFVAMRSSYGSDREIEHCLAAFQTATVGLQTVSQVGTIPTVDSPDVPALYLVHSDSDMDLAQQVATALQEQGRPCRLGPSIKKGSDRWLTAVGTELSQAYAVVCLVGRQTAHDRWVQVELLAAQDKRKPIVALQLPETHLPAALPSSVAIFPFASFETLPVAELLAALPPQPDDLSSKAEEVALSPALLARAAELLYMDSLRLAELHYVGQYTRLAGQTQFLRSRSDRLLLNPVVARTEFHHAPWRQGAELPEAAPPRPFEDAVTELQAIRRAVLLGDPGSGKTTTLYKLAADLIDTALLDRSAPVPLLVRLGQWTDSVEPFTGFLRRSVGDLAEGLTERLVQGRAVLLLDGINEIPAGQQGDKYRQVRQFLAQHRQLMAIVTCREQDYLPERDLTLDRVTVAPLDAARIYEFVGNYLNWEGKGDGDDLFWKLAGEDAAKTYQRFTEIVGSNLTDPFATFWLAQVLPDDLTWGYSWDQNRHWKVWLKARAHSDSLLLLATNPYMLLMLLDVYQAYDKTLPVNRGQLFDWFTTTLLRREQVLGPDQDALLNGLRLLAFAMQMQRVADQEEASVIAALPLRLLLPFLDARQQYLAASANLLIINESVRFSHQLLQEYFIAREMRERIWGDRLYGEGGEDQRLVAAKIWPPESWWQPTNWEEATILLAGLYSDDCTPVLKWLADAQPELAARCIVESGAYTPDVTKQWLRDRWLPRLTDMRRDPDARARAAVGRALGRITLADGTPLDNRPGVGVVLRGGLPIPDIVWGEEVPVGIYTVGGDQGAYMSFDEKQVQIEQPYQLARYPVTCIQFDCFVNAPDFVDELWWWGLPQKEQQIDSPYFPFYTNSPRETVSWYQAVAFCRWLSDKLGIVVDLPHEYEWEVAVRYPDNHFYPWGNRFDAMKANTGEGDNLGQTSAVGIYPQGRNPVLDLDDMSGNVWEWCRNKYSDPDETEIDHSGDQRVVRGGSWDFNQANARSAYRFLNHPSVQYGDFGFRVVRRFPSHAD